MYIHYDARFEAVRDPRDRCMMKKEYDFTDGRRGAVLKVAPGKTRITIRLDDDVLDGCCAPASRVACPSRVARALCLDGTI